MSRPIAERVSEVETLREVTWGIYGRATGDLDLFVEPVATNAARLGKALRAFGFRALARDAARFAESDRAACIPIRVAPPTRKLS